MKTTRLMRRIEQEQGRPLRAVIGEMLADGMSREQMARHLDISYWTLTEWLKQFDAARETAVS